MNHIFGRLAIGTAAWGKEYNGAKVSEDDQKHILDYCREVGIDMIDTATAYEWDWTKIDPYFKVVVKVNTKKDLAKAVETNPFCVMAHSNQFFKNSYVKYATSIRKKNVKTGVSLYCPDETDNLTDVFADIIQIPYSLYDRRFDEIISYWKYLEAEGIKKKIHVRSVFLRGRILEDFSPHDCITFCLTNPYIDRIILGADSYDQFIYNLARFDTMCSSQVDDENIIDVRKWEEEK